jgi:hypothetical protein
MDATARKGKCPHDGRPLRLLVARLSDADLVVRHRPRFVLTHDESKAWEGSRSALRAPLGIEAECPEPGATIALE